ncbi:unnamed protein product [Rhizophagus irregularis]|nr:unnamed protein product [Rhizophagus irregularis]
MINNKTKIRNILLIGNAGKGKSTLINILTETNEFEESTDLINGTSKTKAKEFEHEKIKYQIIDIVGIRIFIQSTKEILNKFKRNVIFDDHVTDYTTIVFINFAEFKDEKACKKNRQGF